MASAELPGDIEYPAEVFDLAFHPQFPLIAAATINGGVYVHEYAPKQNKELFSISVASRLDDLVSCRACVFSDDGGALFTASTDRSIKMIDMGTGRIVATLANAHGASINKLVNLVEQNILVSGDDDGMVKFWDIRSQNAAATFDVHKDYISGLAASVEKKRVVASSGDGFITIMDYRNGKHKETNKCEDEPLCVEVVKGGSNVIAGSQSGQMHMYKWNEWDDMLEKISGHQESVDAVIKLDESTVCTGSSDGMIRVLSILPNKVQGILGMHDGFPVENLAISGDRKYLGSCSHDKLVKFWNIQELSLIQQATEVALPAQPGTAAAAAPDDLEDSDEEGWEDDDMAMSDDEDGGFDYTGANSAGSGNFFSDL